MRPELKKSQSLLVGLKQRRYRRRRPSYSSAFRRFRSAFAAGRSITPPVKNGPYRKDGAKGGSAGRHLSRKGILAALLLTLLTAAILPGYQFVENSELFRLRKISVQGNRVTNEKEIAALIGIRQGQSLLSFSADEAERRICRHPWIDRAEVRKAWPAVLQIQVEERRPLALINFEGGGRSGLHYVDQRGTVFAPAAPEQDLDFPVITGLVAPADGPPQFSLTDDRAAAEAMQFLHFAAQGNPILPLQSVSEIHLSREQGIVVYLAERPFPIYFGYGNIISGCTSLVKLLKRLYDKEKIDNIREIRIDHQLGRILVAKLRP